MEPHSHTQNGRRRDHVPSGAGTRSRTSRTLGGLLLALVIGFAASPASAAAATLFVDKQLAACTDGVNGGTAARPYCTIGAAAAKATGGTIVQVSAGTYSEEVSPRTGAAGNPVVFRADAGETVTVTGGTYGFYISGKTWVTVEGFNITDTVSDAVHVSSLSKNVTIRGNTISLAGEPVAGSQAKGISLTDSSDSLIEGNVVHHNSNYGIYLVNAQRNKIVGNETSFNARVVSRGASGIRLHTSADNTISSNVTHHNEDSGIELVTSSSSNLLVNNLTYDNGDHGIDNLDAAGQRIISNSVYNNVTAGINAEGTSTGTLMANNVSVDNGIGSPRTTGNIRVDATSLSGSSVDYDLVHLRASGVQFVWGADIYSSVSAFRAATGQEAHGLEGDPLWAAPASGNMHLTVRSPAIDSASSAVSGAAAVDLEGSSRIDDPARANTGAGTRTYDDRGAYEYPATDLAPTASLTVTPTAGSAPLAVTADASASSDFDATPIASYRFDFGDGTVTGPQAQPTAGHTYTSAGTRTVTVTVTDTAGLSSTATTQVTVNPPPNTPPNAALTVTPGSGAAPLAVTADASGSSDDTAPIATYRFDFGDGTVVGPQAGATAGHTYAATGTFAVTVVVTDTAGLSSTASTQVAVTEGDAPPSAALTVSPGSGTAPLLITADASASTDTDATPIASYRFDFGDGTVKGPQAASSASHTYNAAGRYTVTVVVTDTADKSSTATTEVTVKEPDLPPSAVLTVSPGSGPAPLALTADASGSTDTDETPIATYRFDFGDGTVTAAQPGATATHTYTAGGNFVVAVTVTDTAGKSATATSQITVYADYVKNGDFETDLSSWNTSGSGTGIALTRVAGGHTGSWAAKLANTGTAATNCTLNDAPNWVKTAASGAYTASLWVRADSPGATLKLRIREYDGPLVGSALKQVTLGTTWQRVSVAYTPLAPGRSTLDYNAYLTDGAPGTCFYADGAAFELGPIIPPDAPDPNLVSNRGFESGLTGWNTAGSGAGIALTREAGGHSGDWSAKVANTGAAASTCTLNDAPNTVTASSTGTYTASMWVRADTAGKVLKLRVREYNGATLVGSQITEVALTPGWEQVTAAYTVAAAGTSSLDINAYMTGAAPGTCFYADDVSLTLG